MRARHRHFNPKHAGATAAFDARYGISVANGSPVDTWNNRTGSNNATATSNARPTFRSSGGNNNSAAVEFDGNLQQMIHSIPALEAPSLFMAVAIRTGGVNGDVIASFMPPYTTSYSLLPALGYGTGSPRPNWGSGQADSGHSILNTWRILSAKPASTATSNSSTTVWTDGANQVTATGSRYGGDGADRRKIGGSYTTLNTMLGSISQVIAVPADVGNPLRKRLEHASAFSFKLACS